MNTKKQFSFVIIGMVQFLLLTAVAMWLYEGGYSQQPSAPEYDFSRNFFSDLGLTTGYDGNRKPLTQWLFTGTLTVAGLALIAYFIFAPKTFSSSTVSQRFAWIGSIFGIFTGIAFIGIAWTPADLFLSAHMLFVRISFPAFLGVTIFYPLAIWKHSSYPRWLLVVYLLFSIILVGFLYLLFWGPSTSTESGLITMVIAQKVVVYAGIVCMLLQAIGRPKTELS